jgi:hypothetical protein
VVKGPFTITRPGT